MGLVTKLPRLKALRTVQPETFWPDLPTAGMGGTNAAVSAESFQMRESVATLPLSLDDEQMLHAKQACLACSHVPVHDGCKYSSSCRPMQEDDYQEDMVLSCCSAFNLPKTK